jgi:hypothetical protein
MLYEMRLAAENELRLVTENRRFLCFQVRAYIQKKRGFHAQANVNWKIIDDAPWKKRLSRNVGLC